jgi:adenylosuccinate synthase
MILDFQYGSTGKGLIAGWLAKRENYDTAVCAFATNAGHTYIDKSRGINMMTQQLPTAISSDTVKNILIGPGAAIHYDTLAGEMERYESMLQGKRILIHPQAAAVEEYHADFEKSDGRTKMGSTAKGVGEAYIERMRRDPATNNTVKNRWRGRQLERFIATEDTYRQALEEAQAVIVEGAQGYSLSMYHGQYPYTTSRDVTPWQVAADCGLPYKWASYIKVVGTLRTMPIRVNNRDGSSGPCYPDQIELDWSQVGVLPEMTTVTKLPRRIFTFSQKQLDEALFHCGGYWDTRLFLNFCNYLPTGQDVTQLIDRIQAATSARLNPPKVVWTGWGPDDQHVVKEA